MLFIYLFIYLPRRVIRTGTTYWELAGYVSGGPICFVVQVGVIIIVTFRNNEPRWEKGINQARS
jgi:hypothetical protein